MGMGLSIVGLLLIMVSLGACAAAKTSIHEIYAAVQFLSGIVLLTGGAAISELRALRNELKKPALLYIDNPPPPKT